MALDCIKLPWKVQQTTKIQMGKMWQIFKMYTNKTMYLNGYFVNILYIMWFCMMTAIVRREKFILSSQLKVNRRIPGIARCAGGCSFWKLNCMNLQQQHMMLQYWKINFESDKKDIPDDFFPDVWQLLARSYASEMQNNSNMLVSFGKITLQIIKKICKNNILTQGNNVPS